LKKRFDVELLKKFSISTKTEIGKREASGNLIIRGERQSWTKNYSGSNGFSATV